MTHKAIEPHEPTILDLLTAIATLQTEFIRAVQDQRKTLALRILQEQRK